MNKLAPLLFALLLSLQGSMCSACVWSQEKIDFWNTVEADIWVLKSFWPRLWRDFCRDDSNLLEQYRAYEFKAASDGRLAIILERKTPQLGRVDRLLWITRLTKDDHLVGSPSQLRSAEQNASSYLASVPWLVSWQRIGKPAAIMGIFDDKPYPKRRTLVAYYEAYRVCNVHEVNQSRLFCFLAPRFDQTVPDFINWKVTDGLAQIDGPTGMERNQPLDVRATVYATRTRAPRELEECTEALRHHEELARRKLPECELITGNTSKLPSLCMYYITFNKMCRAYQAAIQKDPGREITLYEPKPVSKTRLQFSAE